MTVENIATPAPTILSAKATLRKVFQRGRCIRQYRADGFTAAVEELIAEGAARATEYDENGLRIVRGNHQPTD